MIFAALISLGVFFLWTPIATVYYSLESHQIFQTGAYDPDSPPFVVPQTQVPGRFSLDAAIDGRGTIHLVWMSTVVSPQFGRSASIGPFYQRGERLGAEWSPPRPFPEDEALKPGNARSCPRVLAAGDTVAAFWTGEGGLVTKLSTDAGGSWAPERFVLDGPLGSNYVLLRHGGNLYLVFGGSMGAHFAKSRDWGVNWTDPLPIGPPTARATSWPPVALAVVGETIHMVGEAADQEVGGGLYAPQFYHVLGAGLGERWEEPHFIELGTARPDSFQPAVALRAIALGQSLLVTYASDRLLYVVTADDGETWSAPRELPAVPPVMQYDLCRQDDSTVEVFWVDLRNIELQDIGKIPPGAGALLGFFGAKPRKNNDLFAATIRDSRAGPAVRLTPPDTYAEILFGALACCPLKEGTLVIWGGKRDFGDYALSDSIKGEVFYRTISKSEDMIDE